MSNFISTETEILISLLGQQMSNVGKFTSDYTTRKTNKKTEATPTLSSISSQVIQEAQKHPSSIMFHALDTIATTQNILSIVNDKLEYLAQQHLAVENALEELQKKQEAKEESDEQEDEEDQSDQEEENTSNLDQEKTVHEEEQSTLEKFLADINNMTVTLTEQKKQLQELMSQIDEQLPTLDTSWQEHVNKSCALITQQLAAQANIELNDAEQATWRNIASTNPNIEETRRNLMTKIKIPEDSSNWYVATIASVTANLSSKLKTNKEENPVIIIKKLHKTLGTIDEETKELHTSYEQTFEKIKDRATEILAKANNQPKITLPPEVKEITSTITTPVGPQVSLAN